MSDRVKNHFEDEAAQYEGIILRLIPYYKEMVRAVAVSLPFSPTHAFDAIDLGCGTGTISQALRNEFPQVRLTLVDLAENMLQIAREKIGPEARYLSADFNTFEFDAQYDAVVSSLALHHLVTEADKQRFYHKIFRALKPGGIFINADMVLAQTENLQQTFLREWVNYMLRSVSSQEIKDKWLPNYEAEDHPISLMRHFEMLKLAGFTSTDVIWKYYGFSVYTARKQG